MPSTKTKRKQYHPYKSHSLWVEPIAGETNMGKIALPDTAQSMDAVPIKGRVVDVSDDCQDVKPGDHILFPPYKGYPLRVDHRDIILLFEDDVYAVMNGEKIKHVRAVANVVFVEWEFLSRCYPGTQLVRPESFSEQQYTGVVLSVGPDVKLEKYNEAVKPGDRVFFERFSIKGKLYEGEKRYAFIPHELIEAIIFKREPVELKVV